MARPRRGKRRRPQRDWLTEFLLTGVAPAIDDPELDDPWEPVVICYRREKILPEWAARQNGIMGSWNRPGCRPWAWWEFEAPRLPMGTFPGWYIDGQFPEPRRHLAGPGLPLHQRLNYAPSQHFGLWDWFGDPGNPPAFESQFDYLKRHGLLLPGESEPLPEPHPHPAQIMDAAAWDRTAQLIARNKAEAIK